MYDQYNLRNKFKYNDKLKNDVNNLVACCKSCNFKKGNKYV